jgi:hypothetical protein
MAYFLEEANKWLLLGECFDPGGLRSCFPAWPLHLSNQRTKDSRCQFNKPTAISMVIMSGLPEPLAESKMRTDSR